MSADDIIYIAAVPLPFLGWRTDRCSCGKKFRGKNRQWEYEIHYRREHQNGDLNFANDVQRSITRAEADRLYAAMVASGPSS